MDIVVECWENERWIPGKGWGVHRLPTDRGLWTDKKGTTLLRREGFLLPPGWRWVAPWQHRPNGTEADGWYYAVDFTIPTRFCSAKQSITSCVRRRQWTRQRVLAVPTDVPPQAKEVSFYGFSNAAENSNDSVAYSDRQHRGVALFADELGTFLSAKADGLARLGSLELSKDKRKEVYSVGFPQSLRGPLWLALSGAHEKRACSPGYYSQIRAEVEKLEYFDSPKHEINIDVLRTLPSHDFFANGAGEGSLRLRALLFCLQAHAPSLPYFQSFSYLASLIVLNVDDDEDAFWLMTCLVCDNGVTPNGYYSQNRLDRDLEVLRELCTTNLDKKIVDHIASRNIDVTLFANGWLQAMMAAHFPPPTACRVLDIVFTESSNNVIVRIALAFLRMHSRTLLETDDPGSLGQFANAWARSLWDPAGLMSRLLDDGLAAEVMEKKRRRFFEAE